MLSTVHFADKTVVFDRQAPAGCDAVVSLAPGERISRAKVLKKLETCNMLAVTGEDSDAAFRSFAVEFTPVVAAGGVAVDDEGRWLMIYRNGRWDLPKGHLEPDESIEACAVREVAEETGVTAEPVRPLCQTLHAYNLYGRWELKRTHWFELRAVAGGPRPQTEEGIERVVWCAPAEAAAHIRESYPTVRRVAACMSGAGEMERGSENI